VVGSNYKTPTSPIWVLHGGNHYTVLIARSKGLLKLVQCVAVCCSVLQCVAHHYTVLIARSKGLLKLVQCVAVCCSVLQCVAVCCSVLHIIIPC